MSTPEIERKVRLWEQHGQTIMMAAVLGVLTFAGNALLDAKTAQAAMAVEVKNMSAQIQRMEGAITAMQAHYVTRGEFAVHEQRIQVLESRRP